MDKQIQEILKRGVVEIIQEDSVQNKLKNKKPLRVKFGIDPTGADLHIGHTVNLWKLRQFQDLGHIAVVIIGDYTASIGDPSGKDKTRPTLSDEQIQSNYKDYERQALCVLREDNLEIRKQTEWFGSFTLKDIIRLTASRSVGDLLSHETFRNRLDTDSPFSSHELLYPFLQGYDSVAVDADIELGAIEQKFNLLMGRVVQKYYNKEPQDVIMSPYLIGTDGKEKMSKSIGNYIGLQDNPNDMFGKVMSIADSEIIPYFEMVSDVNMEDVEKMKQQGTPSGSNARDLKMKLAYKITETFYKQDEADNAQSIFMSVFQRGDVEKNAKKIILQCKEYILLDLLACAKMASSKKELKRKIEEGAVYVDEIKQKEVYAKISINSTPKIVRIGKRNVASISCNK